MEERWRAYVRALKNFTGFARGIREADSETLRSERQADQIHRLMNSNITTAVILAAGLGSRLKHHTQDQPKGFLEVEGKSLIERSIESLIQKGIRSVIIGTGYLPEYFEALKKKFPVITFRNEDYSTTGSMYTLYVLKHLIREPILLLESDLLYDPISLDYLLEDSREDVILASDATNSGDE